MWIGSGDVDRGDGGDGAGDGNLPTMPVAIAAGDEHTCALPGDGSVWCWGRNEGGQLGNGSVETSATPVTRRHDR